MATATYFPLNEVMDMAGWPLGALVPEALDQAWVTAPMADFNAGTVSLGVLIEFEVLFKIPGLDQLTLALGPEGATEFILTLTRDPFSASVQVPLVLRVDADILCPLKPGTKERDLNAETLDINLGRIGLTIDANGHVDLDLTSVVSVPPCMVGTTGVLLEIGQLKWVTPATPPEKRPPNTPAGFTGIYFDDVTVEIPQLPTAVSAIRMDDVFIGTGGFSGKVSRPGLVLEWNGSDFTGDMHGDLLGFKGGITSMSIEFRQNALVGCEIVGDVFIPYLNKRVGLTLGLDGSGGLTATAALPHSSPPETGVSTGSVGYLIHLNVANVLALDVASLRFEALSGSLPRLGIAGRIAPGPGILDFPPIDLTGLWIDSRGRIQTEGDGIRLPNRYLMNFKGFQIEISKLGLGNSENGGKWIAFTGGVRLVAGMPAGASVEGLRITWYEDGRPMETTLNGVGVEFEVPNVIRFAGAVSFSDNPPQFRGAIKLDLMALKMLVDGTAVFGVRDGKTYLAIYLAAEFPAGIPLFATGLGVYGMAGLFALNMEPNRQASQEWYAIGSQTDWYHKSPLGVTSLDKWTAQIGSMAVGAGVTLGTVADNGYTFSGRMLLVILFPGPILVLQGAASLLQERAKLDTEANFRAIGVLDGRAGTLQIGLDAQYRYDNTGALIDIHGAADSFFNFNDANAWRLNLGLNEPRDRRLTARLFKLFDANAYVMLNAQQLAMGAWIGFKKQWQFGPLSVAVDAWIEGNARVSWKPAHFYGDLQLHGSAKLGAFGFSISVTVDARIAADVFDPFHVLGEFRVAIDLPWPLPDLSASIKLQWGPNPAPPPAPLPLKEIAVEHFKATTSWPLPRAIPGSTQALLFPNYDKDGDGFLVVLGDTTPPVSVDHAPIVPLDSRPHVTFARNVNDDALVGVNAQAVVPEWERIGDPVKNQGPARVRYGLQEVALEKKLPDGSWKTVARKATDANAPDVRTLYGSWAPVPQMPGGGGRNTGQVKLWLWSKTPFEYTRSTSRMWDEWFTDSNPGYPCQPQPSKCWDFENIELASGLPNPWSHPDEPGPSIAAELDNALSVIALSRPVHGVTHAFGITIPERATFRLGRSTKLVRIMLTDGRLYRVTDFVGVGTDGKRYPAVGGGTPDAPSIDIAGTDIVRVDYFCEVFLPISLVNGVGGAIGCDYIPSRNQLIFVEFSGKLSAYDLTVNKYVVLGTGYTNPEDVTVTADGTMAYVTERSGALLRVDLTAVNLNRSAATVVSDGMSEPHQIALDEARGKAYVVEFGGAGRLLRIDLDGETAGKQTVLVTGLEQALGLLITADAATAYVSEQGGGGRLTRITLSTGARQIVAAGIPAIFLLRWANAARDSIFTVQRDPINSVVRIDLTKTPAQTIVVRKNVPFRPSSMAVLPDERHAICSDSELTLYAVTLLVPKICDGGSDLLVHHFEEELVRWSQIGEVFEPYTRYRLKIGTMVKIRGEGKLAGYARDVPIFEYAYFRTDGPPGVAKLALPIGSESISSVFTSGLDDLSRYVLKTMPRVAASTPAAPVPAPLSYRAYDVGIWFDENYVDLMYRLGRRDLSLQFYDPNGAIRDDAGRRLVLTNQWGLAEEIRLKEREERWRAVIDASGCKLILAGTIVKDTTFGSGSAPHLFPPASLCEARLIPALLHDAFGGYAPGAGANGPNGSIERWRIQDDAGSVASRWEIRADGTTSDLVAAQITHAATALVYGNAAGLPADQADPPANWTDYRFTARLRSTDGKIGVVWRYQNAAQQYRFVMDRQSGRRQLLRGVSTELASDAFTYQANQSCTISVDAVGTSLRVFLDGALVFAVNDSTSTKGSIGLYCSGNPSAKFTDVVVDDFRTSAPVVYRFSFVTSRFRNFTDHLGSYEGRTYLLQLAPSANVAAQIAAAAAPASPVSEAESRAYDAFLAKLSSVSPTARAIQVSRVEQSGSAIAFLVHSPEPFDWKRIELQVLRAPLQTANYGPVNIRVLRKADGAGLFIVSPAATPPGSLLAPGEYRFIFTYRRNNRVIDSGSDILSEAGNTAPEQATLDIPWQT